MTVRLKSWREAWRNQVRQAAEEMELPQSAVAGGLRLMLDGNELELQGSSGILEYSPERICVAASSGCIRVTGWELHLTDLGKDALRLHGKIVAIELLEEDAYAV